MTFEMQTKDLVSSPARIKVLLGANGAGKSFWLTRSAEELSKCSVYVHSQNPPESTFRHPSDSDNIGKFLVLHIHGDRVVRPRSSMRLGDHPSSPIANDQRREFMANIKQKAAQHFKRSFQLYDETDSLRIFRILNMPLSPSVSSESPQSQPLGWYRLDAEQSLNSQIDERRLLITQWLASHPRRGECPPWQFDKPSTFDAVFNFFSTIYPQLTLSLDMDEVGAPIQLSGPQNNSHPANIQCHLRCTASGSLPYSIESLSQGERQVLNIAILCDLIQDLPMVLIVDEPEMNLEPNLAHRLWDAVELTLTNTHFIYATHSLDFALRSSIHEIYLTKSRDHRPTKIDALNDSNREIAERLLGAARSITTQNRLLVVEGQSPNESFDPPFYSWLLGDDKNLIVRNFGSRSEATKATAIQKIRDAFIPPLQVVIVHDRDYPSLNSSDQAPEKTSDKSVLQLDLHDAEAYLCDAELLHHLTTKLKHQHCPVTEQELNEAIIDWAMRQKYTEIVKHLNARYSVLSHFAFDKRCATPAPSTDHEVIDRLRRSYNSFASASSPKELPDETYQELCDSFNQAILKQNYLAIRQLYVCKDLLDVLSKLVGCSNSRDLLHACTQHLKVDDYRLLVELRCKITNAFKTFSEQSTVLVPSR